MALLWLLGAASVALGQAPPSSAPPKSITVVMDDNYPPFVFRDSNGQLQGILKDTWALWQAHTGIAVRLQAMDWSQAQRAMLAGQADVIDTIFVTGPRRRLLRLHRAIRQLCPDPHLPPEHQRHRQRRFVEGFTVGVKDGDACIDVLRRHGVDSMKTTRATRPSSRPPAPARCASSAWTSRPRCTCSTSSASRRTSPVRALVFG
ncbi:MAG: transporter substrate-binding domain-containing protein [Ideonella sp.]|nr:transporter substrate-binding domain-containing protein [Ideonella sp.]